MLCDRLWRDARLVTMAPGREGLGIVVDGVIACCGGRIVFAGEASVAPVFEPRETIFCDGRWITPGLIDPHTHMVWAGNRAGEFEQRLAGASYEAIAHAGGGILATMAATRAASEDELLSATLPRLDAMLAHGVTTVEVKSGYGLRLEDELKQLRVARQLGAARQVTVRTTFLGAHALPPEFAADAGAYITHICETMLPAVAQSGLADAVDAFCEGIGFNLSQVRRVFSAAQKLGLPVKIHAEQLSNLHGTALACLFGALSADHLEYLDSQGIAALSKTGTVATLLPGAFYFTRETQRPPIEKLRQARVPLALATDCNPGSSPLTSPLLAMNMAATLFGMTVAECLAGMTRNAALALGLAGETGSLEAGKWCDLAIWDIEQPAELVYHIGLNPLHARVWRGL